MKLIQIYTYANIFKEYNLMFIGFPYISNITAVLIVMLSIIYKYLIN